MSFLHLLSISTLDNLLIKTNKKNYNDKTLKKSLSCGHPLKIETLDIK